MRELSKDFWRKQPEEARTSTETVTGDLPSQTGKIAGPDAIVESETNGGNEIQMMTEAEIEAHQNGGNGNRTIAEAKTGTAGIRKTTTDPAKIVTWNFRLEKICRRCLPMKSLPR